MPKIDPRRLEETERRYLRGEPNLDIERDLAAKFKVTRRQVRNYLAIVRKRLAEAAQGSSPDEHRARVEALLLNAYRVAKLGAAEKGPNANAMVAAAHRLGELHGVMAPQRLEHSGRDGAAIQHETVARVVLLPALEDADDDADAAGRVAPEPGPADPVP